MLTKRRGTGSTKNDDFDDGLVFFQSTEGKKKKYRGKCHKCDKWGHKAKDCTAAEETAGADDDRSRASGYSQLSQERAARRAAPSTWSG